MNIVEPVRQTAAPSTAVLLVVASWLAAILFPDWSGIDMVSTTAATFAAFLGALSAIFVSIAFKQETHVKGRKAELIRGLSLAGLALCMSAPSLVPTGWDGLAVFIISMLGGIVCAGLGVTLAFVAMARGRWRSRFQEVSALATPLSFIALVLSLAMPTAFAGNLSIVIAAFCALTGFMAALLELMMPQTTVRWPTVLDSSSGPVID